MTTTVEAGYHMCVKPRQCNCVYIPQSPMGCVTLFTDGEQCQEFTHEFDVSFPVNLAEMQYLWSDNYIKNLSEQLLDKPIYLQTIVI